MIAAPVALAFTAGMVATLNPCGFSLLPAYIGTFVGGDEIDLPPGRRVLRAVGVAVAVSVGFVIVFGLVGIVIDSAAGEVRRQLPWITIGIGGLLAVTGAAMVAGWSPVLDIARPVLGSGRRGVVAMVGYGATYAIASLSCTIGPFLAVTGTAVSMSRFDAVAVYVAYAVGMGMVILAISVSAAVAHEAVANRLRSLTRFSQRIGGALMVVAGGYAIWYGRWEQAVYGGDLGTDPVIDTVETIRLGLVEVLQRVGLGSLFAMVTLGSLGFVAFARLRREPKH